VLLPELPELPADTAPGPTPLEGTLEPEEDTRP
jgi:hypothetical protein